MSFGRNAPLAIDPSALGAASGDWRLRSCGGAADSTGGNSDETVGTVSFGPFISLWCDAGAGCGKSST